MVVYILSIWIALTPPAIPPKMAFGPFYSVGDCERAYQEAAQKYVGTVPVQHECRPIVGKVG